LWTWGFSPPFPWDQRVLPTGHFFGPPWTRLVWDWCFPSPSNSEQHPLPPRCDFWGVFVFLTSVPLLTLFRAGEIFPFQKPTPFLPSTPLFQPRRPKFSLRGSFCNPVRLNRRFPLIRARLFGDCFSVASLFFSQNSLPTGLGPLRNWVLIAEPFPSGNFLLLDTYVLRDKFNSFPEGQKLTFVGRFFCFWKEKGDFFFPSKTSPGVCFAARDLPGKEYRGGTFLFSFSPWLTFSPKDPRAFSYQLFWDERALGGELFSLKSRPGPVPSFLFFFGDGPSPPPPTALERTGHRFPPFFFFLGVLFPKGAGTPHTHTC